MARRIFGTYRNWYSIFSTPKNKNFNHAKDVNFLNMDMSLQSGPLILQPAFAVCYCLEKRTNTILLNDRQQCYSSDQ